MTIEALAKMVSEGAQKYENAGYRLQVSGREKKIHFRLRGVKRGETQNWT